MVGIGTEIYGPIIVWENMCSQVEENQSEGGT